MEDLFSESTPKITSLKRDSAPVAEELPVVTIYTDGSGSDGASFKRTGGGWAAVLIFVSPTTGEIIEKELSGFEPRATSQRMEVMAAVIALEALRRPCQATLHTDSMYLLMGATKWLPRWAANGFERKRGKRKGTMVAHQDLWLRVGAMIIRHDVRFVKVKAHSGDPDNARVDRLAGKARKLGLRGQWAA